MLQNAHFNKIYYIKYDLVVSLVFNAMLIFVAAFGKQGGSYPSESSSYRGYSLLWGRLWLF